MSLQGKTHRQRGAIFIQRGIHPRPQCSAAKRVSVEALSMQIGSRQRRCEAAPPPPPLSAAAVWHLAPMSLPLLMLRYGIEAGAC